MIWVCCKSLLKLLKNLSFEGNFKLYIISTNCNKNYSENNKDTITGLSNIY